MNKKVKRIAGLMFVMILIIGQLMGGTANVQAATKSPKLNRTSLTITVEKSKKLTVRNGKDGLFTTNSTRIKDYIDKKVLEKK